MKKSRAAAAPVAARSAPVAGAAAVASPWVAGPWVDLPLMVAAPGWILVLMFVLTSFSSDRAINNWVAALGAIGHHLPGMLRAYGDRALFRRFTVRFLAAPAVLITLCYQATEHGVQAVIVIAFLWGVWHALAQSYGFARIYAMKAGCGDRASALADRALLITWFVAALVWSPLRLGFMLDELATCGLGLPSAAQVAALRYGVMGLAVAATVGWLVVVARGAIARRGPGPGVVRLLLLATSIGFWWYANVRVQHLLLAAPLFELFHDAQYLTIAWIYNRRRADVAGAQLQPAVAALFRPRAVSIAGYVAVCAAYGFLAFYASKPQLMGPQQDAAQAQFSQLLTSLVAASQLLHFYYDGFIWKVREAQTAGVLGVASSAPVPVPVAVGSWPFLRHGLLWALLLVAYGGLWYGENASAMPMPARLFAVSDLVPDNIILRFPAAEMRWKDGQRDLALDGFRAVVALDPGRNDVRRNLAISLAQLGDERYAAGDAAGLAPLARELAALRPGLDEEMTRFIDGQLTRWRSPR